MDAICTVIAHNYFSQAMVLANSLRGTNENFHFIVLVVDGLSRDIPWLPNAEIMIAEDLELEKEIFHEMCSYYDLFEISTAVKPTLLKTLLSRGYETVTFIDPDTKVFGSMEIIKSISRSTSIILTPHRYTPLRAGIPNLTEKAYLRYGVFNLGFISVNATSVRFLDWWEERLRWDCRRYTGEVSYTDQKWIDLVPAYFDYHLLRHKGFNLAPWNLDERPITINKSRTLYAGEDELIFVHFSQMSSQLASGNSTDAWERHLSGLSDLEESLEFVLHLTKDYSSELRLNRLSVNSQPYPIINWPKESFHLRSYRIGLSIGNKNNLQSGGYRLFYTFRILDPLIMKFEKFSTFNSLIDGLIADYERIKLYFRKKYLD